LYGNLLGAKKFSSKGGCDIGAHGDRFHRMEDTIMMMSGWTRGYNYGAPSASVTVDTVRSFSQILVRRIQKAIRINDGEVNHRHSITMRVGCVVNIMLKGTAEISRAARQTLGDLSRTYRQIPIDAYVTRTRNIIHPRVRGVGAAGQGAGRGAGGRGAGGRGAGLGAAGRGAGQGAVRGAVRGAGGGGSGRGTGSGNRPTMRVSLFDYIVKGSRKEKRG